MMDGAFLAPPPAFFSFLSLAILNFMLDLRLPTQFVLFAPAVFAPHVVQCTTERGSSFMNSS
jgi:hypothetical protein